MLPGMGYPPADPVSRRANHRSAASAGELGFLPYLCCPYLRFSLLPHRRTPIVVVACLALLILGYVNFRAERQNVRLYDTYFSAIPAGGYGTQRSLSTLGTYREAGSILRQGIQYHQQGKYNFALAALRNYLEGNPLPGDHSAALLAATAAAATGDYPSARYFLDQMPREEAEQQEQYNWYRGLFALREGQTARAKKHFTLIAERSGPYQTAGKEILDKIK